MHQQIKQAIGTLMPLDPGNISIRLSSGEATAMGKLLYIMYYQTKVLDLLPRSTTFGYPHNGGQHTFEYHGIAKDFVAFIELFKEELERFTLTPEQSLVASQLSYISQEILALKRKV